MNQEPQTHEPNSAGSGSGLGVLRVDGATPGGSSDTLMSSHVMRGAKQSPNLSGADQSHKSKLPPGQPSTPGTPLHLQSFLRSSGPWKTVQLTLTNDSQKPPGGTGGQGNRCFHGRLWRTNGAPPRKYPTRIQNGAVARTRRTRPRAPDPSRVAPLPKPRARWEVRPSTGRLGERTPNGKERPLRERSKPVDGRRCDTFDHSEMRLQRLYSSQHFWARHNRPPDCGGGDRSDKRRGGARQRGERTRVLRRGGPPPSGGNGGQ